MSTDATRYTIESAELTAPAEVTEARLVEALDEPYRLDVHVTVADPDADVAPLLGKDVLVRIERSNHVRRICGVVRRIEEGRHGHEDQSVHLVVVPALWMLRLRRNTKIFQEMSAPDILQAVLGDALGPYGRQVSLELKGSYARREYCVQYQETDLDFVHRLMEEEGISYSFDHEGDQELLVLRDDNASYPELADGALVSYLPHELAVAGEDAIQRFRLRHGTTTTSAVVADWDWTRNGDMRVTSEDRTTDAAGKDRESYEHGRGRSVQLWDYDQGVRRYREEDSAQQARVRREAHVRSTLTGAGVSRRGDMAPGTVFELTGHPNVGADGRYLVLRVEHVSQAIDDVLEGGSSEDTYYNRFECVPFDTAHRPPRRARKPRIAGVQTAVVTGPSGEEIHTDEHGRIKVQFHWDRDGEHDDKSSCWIRVQQPWAGNGWGVWYLPRIGMEVVVRFVDGDPDRPLVTGCVYNASNPLPYPLPDEKTKSTIKSNSSPGGGGFNEFRFEDMKGSEQIYTHAQKDYNEVVEHDHTTHVKHDQTNTVDNDQTQTVGNDQTETIHRHQTMTVDANRSVHVKSDFEEKVDGTETRTVTGDVTESFDANETRAVTGNLTETVGGNETRTITGNQTETVSGNLTLDVGGSSTQTVAGSLSQTVLGGVSATTAAAYQITAVGGLNITAPAGVTLETPGPVSIMAPGGYTMVDLEWKWVGNLKEAYGAFDWGITVVNMSFSGLVQGVTGLKAEFTGVEASFTKMKIETCGFALNAAVFAVLNRALVAEKGVTVEG